MREHLFKAKRIDSDEWVEGSLAITDKKCFIVYDNDFNETSDCCGKHLEADRFFEVIPETVCQDTGLTDKNGTKIFEGDRLKAKAYWAKADRAKSETIECLSGEMYSRVIEKGETVWTVEYANWNSFIGFRVYGVDRRWSAPLTYNKLYNGECEIIGNIHDKE